MNYVCFPLILNDIIGFFFGRKDQNVILPQFRRHISFQSPEIYLWRLIADDPHEFNFGDETRCSFISD
jgi:hypothetical protein